MRRTSIVLAGLIAACVAGMVVNQSLRAADAEAKPSAGPPRHSMDSFDQIKERLKKSQAVMLDVRTKREWDQGHLADAKLLTLNDIVRGEIGSAKLDKKQIIYCHCRSGGRALTAAKHLQERGFDVRPLKAGYAELVEAGFADGKARTESTAGGGGK